MEDKVRAVLTAICMVEVDLKGDITLGWDIVDEGLVKNPHVIENRTTLNNKNVQNCLMEILSDLKFPPSPPRNTVSILYPFHFLN